MVRLIIPCFAPHKQTKVEGFLFPATYDFLAKTTSKQLVAQQVKAFCQNWKSVNMSYARSKNLTSYDVLTIASLIQGEAVVESERATIAAVIYNRLHLRMPLGIDAALRYALDIPPHRVDSRVAAPATRPVQLRLHTGLPPTPINNPGLASIRAAAHPAKVDYLYFVAKARQAPPLLHGERDRVPAVPLRARLRLLADAHVALLGQPGRAVAVAAHAERGVRRARARLALRRLRRRRRRRAVAALARSASPART